MYNMIASPLVEAVNELALTLSQYTVIEIHMSFCGIIFHVLSAFMFFRDSILPNPVPK